MRECLDMADVKLKYLLKDPDRFGNVRWYFRKRGQPKIRLDGVPGSETFAAGYHAALKGMNVAATPERAAAKQNSLRWLIEQYYDAAAYKTLEESTKHARKLILDKLCIQATGDAKHPTVGDLPFKTMRKRDVRELRDEKIATPEAANALLKALRQVFQFAVDDEHLEHSPAEHVAYIPSKSPGFHTWTVDEIRQYERRHPIGTMARLALGLLAFLGQRRSDAVRFGDHMVRLEKGRRILKFIQHKGRNKKPVELELPLLPELEAIISQTPRLAPRGKAVALTWLQTEWGLSFTANGFGNKMRDWCDQAELHHCTAHGLRKAGATIAAENGASTHDLNSIFGWRTLKEAFRYTEKVRQKKLAEGSMHKIVPVQSENESVPLAGGVAKTVRKRGKKS